MEKRRKYKSLTVKRKLEVIERVESLPPGKKKKYIAAEFGIPQSTLSTILKDKEKLLVTCTTGNAKRKRYRESTKPEVDAALYQWFTAARADSIPISGEILKSKAEEFSTEFGVPEWSCSCGWISRWKEHHNIAFRSVSGENASVDKSLCEDWRSCILKPLLSRYDPNDVFNADETGLYWRMLPDKTHAFRGEPCTGKKVSKERLTVLVCANMTGMEKCPLLTIGKFKKPRCFRGVLVLPTEYQANPSAWMTASIFEEWLRKWDNKLTRSGRMIVLFVDNCRAHPHIESQLVSIKLMFLPPNTTSETQPCDQGIIHTMKAYYRKSMVKNLIRSINSGSPTEFKITLLDSLEMLKKSWELVTPSTISNCFRKGGFVVAVSDDDPFSDIDAVSDDDPFSDIDAVSDDDPFSDEVTFKEYVSADENLQCFPLQSTEDIVASISQTETDEDEDKDDTGEPLAVVTHQQAYDAYLQVRSYLLRHSSAEDDSPYSLLKTLEFKLKNGTKK